MATELTKLVDQLSTVSNDLTKASEGVVTGDVTKEFGETLDSVIGKLQAVSRSMGAGGAVFVLAFDELITGPLANFVKLSESIGGDVKSQCDALQEAFKAQRAFLAVVADSKVPSPSVLQALLKPTADQIAATQQVRDNNRGNKEQFNHLTAISEGVPAIGWVTVIPKPRQYVNSMSESAQFYTNRVLKEFKEKDKKHVEWARAFHKLLADLGDYIDDHHPQGVAWNVKGKEATAPSAAPAAGGAPPPPPPGPPPPPAPVPTGGEDGGDKQAAAAAQLFNQINQGGTITSHLKKVTPDMQTHKNPALRTAGEAPPTTTTKARTGPAPFKATSSTVSSVAAPGPKKAAPKKEPKFGLEGKKWIVEHHEGNRDLVVEGNMKQTVYIYKCKDSTIQVKGKINSITLDACKKTAIVFENVLGTVDFINCQSVQAQVTGTVPTISIDKTDGVQIYLSKESMKCQLVSAKSSEMNVLLPDESGEYSEYPLPEQYKTQWNGKKLVTECTESV